MSADSVKTTRDAQGRGPEGAGRLAIVFSALLALFLGALDTLIMGSAMPTVVADLGGLHLYGWVFSAYLLSRAVALPVCGKLADLYGSRRLFLCSVGVFLAGSAWAGAAPAMGHLIAARAVQGLGSGGNFALVYIVLTEVSEPQKRGKMLSLASIVWGVASVLGPPLGGFVVDWVSWRWIFWMNLPLGALSLFGLYFFLHQARRRNAPARIDAAGILLLVVTVLALLTAFLRAGEGGGWLSVQTLFLFGLSILGSVVFVRVERRAADPVLPVDLFRISGFRNGNGASFVSSFAIFSLAAYAPLFFQGVLNLTPSELGLAMVPLSLGWSFGAWACGQQVHRIGRRRAAGAGGGFLAFGAALAMFASPGIRPAVFSGFLALAGVGMGFVSIATLLIVQDSLAEEALGVATASHQFSRTLGGTIGVGVAGTLLSSRVSGGSERFEPSAAAEALAGLGEPLQRSLQQGLDAVFAGAAAATVICLIFCWRLPAGRSGDSPPSREK